MGQVRDCAVHFSLVQSPLLLSPLLFYLYGMALYQYSRGVEARIFGQFSAMDRN